MRPIFLLLLMFVSFNSHSWECGSYDRYEQPIEKHLEIASDVIIGDVIRGEVGDVKRRGYDVQITIRPTLVLKGDAKGELILYTSSQSPFERFELAGTYAIFLYGSNEVSFCNLVLPFWVSISSREDLEEYISRINIEGVIHYKPLLDYKKP